MQPPKGQRDSYYEYGCWSLADRHDDATRRNEMSDMADPDWTRGRIAPGPNPDRQMRCDMRATPGLLKRTRYET